MGSWMTPIGTVRTGSRATSTATPVLAKTVMASVAEAKRAGFWVDWAVTKRVAEPTAAWAVGVTTNCPVRSRPTSQPAGA